jgi:hypothetical protein
LLQFCYSIVFSTRQACLLTIFLIFYKLVIHGMV